MRFRTKAWLGLVAYVVAVEVAAPENELLSDAYDDWLLKDHSALIATAVTLTVAGHLLNAIPERYDWIHQLGLLLTRGNSHPVDGQITEIGWDT